MSKIVDKLADIAIILGALSAAATATVVVAQRLETTAAAKPREVAEWSQYAESGFLTGSSSGGVKIIEFADYECPGCRQFKPHLDAILRKYPKDVQLVYRHWPLDYHESAYPASRAAICAGDQGRYWEYHDALYASDGWMKDSDEFQRLADQVGVLDTAAFRRCQSSDSKVERIEADIAAALKLEARGTPTVIINGLEVNFRDSLYLDELVQDIRRDQGAEGTLLGRIFSLASGRN